MELGRNSNDTRTNPGVNKEIREGGVDLPIQNIIGIMQRALPPHAEISTDATEVMQKCVKKYINTLTSMANKQCHKEARRRVKPEDILAVMPNLGQDQYIGPLKGYLDRYRKQEEESYSVDPTPKLQHALQTPSATQLPYQEFGFGSFNPGVDVNNHSFYRTPQGYDQGGSSTSSAMKDDNFYQVDQGVLAGLPRYPTIADYFKALEGFDPHGQSSSAPSVAEDAQVSSNIHPCPQL